MKKKMLVAMALVMGTVSVGSMTAFAAEARGRCVDEQTFQQYTKETAGLTSEIKAKDLEVAQQSGYGGIERGYDGPDMNRISEIQAERKVIKEKIDAIAKKYGVRSCCVS